VTLDWTASEESYQGSTTSDETAPHTMTSPESVVMSTEYTSQGARNTMTSSHPSTRLVQTVPNLRAHSAALTGGQGSTALSVGLMMRPFVDGNVTVTPLVGDGTYPRHAGGERPVGERPGGKGPPGGGRSGGERSVGGERLPGYDQLVPLQSYPSDRDDLASNITEAASIDSKVTIYDNIHYLYV